MKRQSISLTNVNSPAEYSSQIEHQDVMRQKTLTNQNKMRKEKRQLILEKARKIKENRDEELEHEENKSNLVNAMLLPVAQPSSATDIEMQQHPTEIETMRQPTQKSSLQTTGSNLVRKVASSIRNKFNEFVSGKSLVGANAPKVPLVAQSKSKLTKTMSTRIPTMPSVLTQVRKPTINSTLTQQPAVASGLRRSTSAFNVVQTDNFHNTFAKTKALKRQSGMSSCASMSSISSLNQHNQAKVPVVANRLAFKLHQYSSNVSLASVSSFSSKDSKKPAFKPAYKVNYSDKHLYQKTPERMSPLVSRMHLKPATSYSSKTNLNSNLMKFD
jgi:hypothetical protein